LLFDVEPDDGIDLISRGKHERFVINMDKFERKIKSKSESDPLHYLPLVTLNSARPNTVPSSATISTCHEPT
jgi:hypothetical protein